MVASMMVMKVPKLWEKDKEGMWVMQCSISGRFAPIE